MLLVRLGKRLFGEKTINGVFCQMERSLYSDRTLDAHRKYVKHKLDKKYPLTPSRKKRKHLRLQNVYEERRRDLERLGLVDPVTPRDIHEEEYDKFLIRILAINHFYNLDAIQGLVYLDSVDHKIRRKVSFEMIPKHEQKLMIKAEMEKYKNENLEKLNKERLSKTIERLIEFQNKDISQLTSENRNLLGIQRASTKFDLSTFDLEFEEIVEHVNFLKSYNIPESHIPLIISNNHNLSKDICLPPPSSLKEILDYFFKIQISNESFRRILQSAYAEMSKIKLSRVDQILTYLQELEFDVDKMLIGWPALIFLDLEKDIKRKIEYFTQFGFSKNHIANIFAAAPKLLSLNLQTDIILKVRYFVNKGISKAVLKNFILASPQSLSLSRSSKIKPMMKYFLKLLDQKPDSPDYILKTSPNVFYYDIGQVVCLKRALTDRIGFSQDIFAKLVLKCPDVLSLDPRLDILQKIDFFVKILEIDKRVFARAVSSFPSFLKMSLPNDIKRKLRFFSQKIGIPREAIPKVAVQLSLFVMDDELLIQKFNFLSSLLQGRDTAIQKIIENPRLLAFSTGRLITKISCLKTLFKIDDPGVRSLVVRYTWLLGYSPKKVIGKIRDIDKVTGLGRDTVVSLVKSCPDILGCSIASIATRMRFLTVEMKRDPKELSMCPYYLVMPIRRFVELRFRYLTERGVSPFRFSLQKMFMSKQSVFLDKVASSTSLPFSKFQSKFEAELTKGLYNHAPRKHVPVWKW